jgi:predicted Zn finger-like uncharacterized protein
MQIVCPSCITSYQIADAAIGPNGRSVRCVRCQTIWHAAAPGTAVDQDSVEHHLADATAATSADALGAAPSRPGLERVPPAETKVAAEPSLDDLMSRNTSELPERPASPPASLTAATPPVALADIPIPIEDAPPLVPDLHGGTRLTPLDHSGVTALDNNGRPDVESVAARRARASARRRRNRTRIALPLTIVALATLSAALLGWRKDIVRHAPQLASFYSAIGLPVNLRGFVFTDLKIGNEIHDGVPVLVVEGLIVSTVSVPMDVPRLRFALRNASGAEIYAWTAQPSQPVLDPFDTMAFRSRLASPPAEGHDIQVRFFTHRDAAADSR